MEKLGSSLKAGQQRSTELLDFVEKWMQLPAETRKDLSHHGAIRSQSEWHPRPWRDELLGDTFDPGNFVYGLALHFLVPQLRNRKKYDWNEETLGDIIESVLAVGLGGHAIGICPGCTYEQVTSIALLLEQASRDLYSVICFFPLHYTIDKLKELGHLAHKQLRSPS